MTDARQNYVNLVAGLTRTTRDRAVATAWALLAQAGLTDAAHDASERVSKLAEEIVHAGRANRELMENLIATEVDKAATRLGFARAEDVQALRDEIAELRASLTRPKKAAASPPAKKTVAAKKPRPAGQEVGRPPAGQEVGRPPPAKKSAASPPSDMSTGDT